jgi:hypothetical protein
VPGHDLSAVILLGVVGWVGRLGGRDLWDGRRNKRVRQTDVPGIGSSGRCIT